MLRDGEATAEVVPGLGGRLGQLDLGDGALLRPFERGLGWAHWGSYPLLPWSNRVPGGRIGVGGVDAVVPITWEDGSAIHGLAADRPWRVVDATERVAELEVAIAVGPYGVRGRQRFELVDGALHQELAVVNEADHPVPAGLGIHPWFRAGDLRVPAAEVWPGEPLPDGPRRPVTSADDLRRLGPPPLLDRCFTGLDGSSADAPGVRLHWAGPISHVVVYTGVAGWACIEPVTMASDGFGMAERGGAGHGVVVLDPGEGLAVRYRFERRPG